NGANVKDFLGHFQKCLTHNSPEPDHPDSGDVIGEDKLVERRFPVQHSVNHLTVPVVKEPSCCFYYGLICGKYSQKGRMAYNKKGECEKKIEIYRKLMYTISTCAVSEDCDQSESS
ncbi:MAG: hypothetical protein LUE19_02640, partial [Clostridiales bacterium]|nr:hypothetical protein [Clostridiales bacterium]